MDSPWLPSTPFHLESLQDQFDYAELQDSKFKQDSLPDIQSHFFLAPLENKPQDPILAAIKLSRTQPKTITDSKLNNVKSLQPTSLPVPLPKELAILTNDLQGQGLGVKAVERWKQAALEAQTHVPSNVLSWDRLVRRAGQPEPPAETTAFLSEQDDAVLASARYHLRPESSRIIVAHVVSVEELYQSLRMTILGTSSRLFRWDAGQEQFVYVAQGERRLRIQDWDETLTSSIVARFLVIGTLLRRLELFIKVLQARTSKDGPTVHAMAHALATVLTYLRETLVEAAGLDDSGLLGAVHSKYEPYEAIVLALSDLYGRGFDAKVQAYPEFESSPVKIISLIYNHLERHVERRSESTIAAIFAYILDTTSQGYLHSVGLSIGYGGQPRCSKWTNPKRDNAVVDRDLDLYQFDDEEEDSGADDVFAELERIEVEFPYFFPKPLLEMLPTAQKSLILLRYAQPDHPLLWQQSKDKRVRWLWSEEEIMGVWNNIQSEPRDEDASQNSALKSAGGLDKVQARKVALYPPEIASDFEVYDLDPGAFKTKSALPILDTSPANLRAFILRFNPKDAAASSSSWPSVTPTLAHLTSLVFHDLLVHASTLSSTLLSIFLTSSNNLNLQLHLTLLRSYLLATAPAFKNRLMDALFSDAGEYGVDMAPHSMSIRSARRRTGRRSNKSQGKDKDGKGTGSKQPWAIGISAGLLEREIWPPVGGDLSFVLRTVIVDSLSDGRELGDVEGDVHGVSGLRVGTGGAGKDEQEGEEEERRRKRHVVLEEASWRIGFAIRDLPVGRGRDGWMNPLSIEALDFLYLDYKPPTPMDVLVSQHILSKYQRVFAFNLRLFRVESAVKSLFRMTRPSSDPLFQTLSQSQKLLLHFRFIAQSFVATLSSYVFDTAIGGNFDPFLEQLSSSSSSSESNSAQAPSDPRPPRFSDVFELEAAHSMVLDRILTAILLRSGQKAVGDLLRQALELVLEFCVIAGELQRERLKEYEAAVMMEDVYGKFKEKMSRFVKVLKNLVDKGPSTQATWTPDTSSGAAKPTGGTAALQHLLVRLDLGQWWTQ